MKRIFKGFAIMIFVIALIVSSVNVFASAQNGITVLIDGYQVEFDVAPTIINGRTMVPLRAIFEALGASVEWEQSTKTVTSTKADTTISLSVGSKSIYINGKEETLDEPATIIDGRTLVPVRAISEAFDCNVEWVDSSRSVIITTSGKDNEKYAPYRYILDRFYMYITHEVDDLAVGEYGYLGIAQTIIASEPSDNLNNIGFTLKDLNSDGVPELLVGERNHSSNGAATPICAAFILKDGEPKLLFQSTIGDVYFLTGEGGIYGAGGGWNSSFVTLYTLDENGSLICHGHYFSEVNDDWSETYHYYNKTGTWDPEESDLLNEEEVYAFHPEFLEWQDDTVFIELTPFAEYEVSEKNRIVPPVVSCKLIYDDYDGQEGISEYEEFVPYPDGYSRKVVYSVEKEVKDFKVLALSYKDYDRSWNVGDNPIITELYTLEKLTPEKPIVVGLEPQVGYEYPRSAISYVDETGKTRYFAIIESGNDGSIQLVEF